MKKLKKIGALLLAVMMLVSLCAVAGADAKTDQTGTIAENGVEKKADHTAVGNTQNIPVIINVHGSLDKVYGPTVTYTYELEPVTVGENVTVIDWENKEAHVKTGVTGAASLSDSTAEFTSSEVTLTDGVGTVTDNITVTIDPTKFTTPGIYRYKISETTATSVLYEAGITRANDHNKDRYLDVYVKYNSDETAFEVYGYVLTEENLTKIEGTDDEPLKWKTPEEKSLGYTEDDYYTVDVQLTKKVTGTMGDKTHEFPFAIAISNQGLHFYSGEAATAPTKVADLTDGTTTTLSATLKNDDVFYIYGLNPKATVNYQETNNTVDSYVLTVTGDNNSIIKDDADANIEDFIMGVLTGTKKTATLNVSNYDEKNNNTSVAETVVVDAANKKITFTNNLTEISPTGVVLRVAPYALMLAAGIVLLAVTRRKHVVAD